MGRLLRDVMKRNLDEKNFRIFSPDENNSNHWQEIAVFQRATPLGV
jgi:xylulose-5-phosphate/fructose-6-phosphate phosphoketolase